MSYQLLIAVVMFPLAAALRVLPRKTVIVALSVWHCGPVYGADVAHATLYVAVGTMPSARCEADTGVIAPTRMHASAAALPMIPFRMRTTTPSQSEPAPRRGSRDERGN